MGFDELSFAMKMRDVFKTVAEDVVDRRRPKYRYATVVRIDRANYKCDVTFNGETSVVTVNMGTAQPGAAGDVVRVEGIGIDKYITDVVGDSKVKLPLAQGWKGQVHYDVVGKTCTVSLAVNRIDSDLIMLAWQPYLIARTLPKPSVGDHGHNLPATNQNEFPVFQLNINGTDLVLSARWSDRTFGKDGWMQTSFSYVIE